MVPTFTEGDQTRVVSHGKIDRFDVVVFHPPFADDKLYIKRVIGLPGESISYENGRLYIDGVELADAFAEDTADFDLTKEFHIDKIPQNAYFVLGDNRELSQDSRSFGYIVEKEIVGIVMKGVMIDE